MAGVLLAVGCGLDLVVDSSPSIDAGSDSPIVPPPPPRDGEAPDVLLPDGALPDGAPPPNDEAIDDDASFLPSNLDAAAEPYVLDAGATLTGFTDIVVSLGSVTIGAADGGTLDLGKDARFDPTCACIVLSVKDWTVPAGTTVNVTGDAPLIVVANGEVKIDGAVKVSLTSVQKGPSDGQPSSGNASGAGGGGGATAGGVGGPGSGAANPRSDGGAPHSPLVLPSLGGNGGDSIGLDAPPAPAGGCGRGGVGGGALQVSARVLRVGPTGRIEAVGAGAQPGCPTYGGGGGGAGGTIFVEGRLVRVAGTLLATGGGGGGGGAAGAAAPAGGDAGSTRGGAGSDGGNGGGKGGQGGDDVAPLDGGAAMRGGGGGGAAGFNRVKGLNVRIDAGTIVPKP